MPRTATVGAQRDLVRPRAAGAQWVRLSAVLCGGFAAALGCVGESRLTVSSSPFVCEPASHADVSEEALRTEFSTELYPLLARTSGGCVGCHGPTSGRTFIV